jgi:hypothetical protein
MAVTRVNYLGVSSMPMLVVISARLVRLMLFAVTFNTTPTFNVSFCDMSTGTYFPREIMDESSGFGVSF